MKKQFKESKSYQRWLTHSKRNLNTAFLNHRSGGYTDTTCYFAHQTVEKALKTFLIFKGILDFPHTHILPALLAQCQDLDQEFKKIKKEINLLDGYYIETKYPSDLPKEYSKGEAEKAVKLAEKIFNFVKTKTSEE